MEQSTAAVGFIALRAPHLANEARWLLFSHQNPTPIIQAGRIILAGCPSECYPAKLGEDSRAKLALVAADFAAQRGKPALTDLAQVVTASRHAAAMLFVETGLLEPVARALLHLAEAQLPRPSPVTIEEGLQATAKVLARGVGYSESYAIRGGFQLIKARLATTTAERLALAQQALASFAQAVKLNPLLKNVYEARMDQAAALIINAAKK